MSGVRTKRHGSRVIDEEDDVKQGELGLWSERE